MPSNLRQQFWPLGANILDLEVAPAPVETETPNIVADEASEADATPVVEAEPAEPSGKTPAEAQRSERALGREEKKDFQRLVQWAGFYNAAIDGSYGRGTRNSMAAWQEANGYEVTSILTTSQRADLLAKYNFILDSLGLEVVRDAEAGIEIMLTKIEVAFDKYE